MIGKILLTAAVIIAAMLFLRSQGGGRAEPAAPEASAGQRRTAMLLALGVVVLTLAISGAIYYWHWQQEHRITIVRVINAHSGSEQLYEVYRRDLRERGFRTTDGRDISLSDAERMEVKLTDEE